MPPLYTQQNFTVVRQIANHTDVTTYYVRAVIRNAYTDEIITTLDLDSKGSQRFSKNWQVPADPSGQGFYISIVTSVYTDSGYTTKSGDYGDEENTYLVTDRPANGHTGVGGGIGMGGGLARRDVRDIVQEELEKFFEKLQGIMPEKPVIPNYDSALGNISNSVKDLSIKIDSIEPAKKTDLTPVLTAVAGVKKAVADIKPSNVELGPVIEKIKELKDQGEEMNNGNKNDIESLMKGLTNELTKSASRDFMKIMQKIGFVPMQKIVFTGNQEEDDDEDEKENEKPININDLAK